MINKIYSFVQKYEMLSRCDTVVCGLSGGADSVCLLLTMIELSKKLGIEVEALHVNHCLRGSESDRDELFCRELCDNLNIPFTAVSCGVSDFAEKNALSVEEAARKLRYGIFKAHSNGKKIATAHNANDNLETVILNLARGTALKGLAGIPPIRDNIIRPLLTVSRAEIEQYLRDNEQTYVTDSTNLSDDYTRNKIRHKILPLIEEINPSAVATSVSTIDVLRTENSLIENETESAYSDCRINSSLRGLKKFNEIIRRRCIAKLLTEHSIPYSYDRLAEADSILLKGGKINLKGDIYLVSDGDILEIKKIMPKSAPELLSADLRIGENSIFKEKLLTCELVECDNLRKIEAVHKKLTFYLADYDKIVGRAIVRNRRYGDRIRLRGRSFDSSVKKLINENVPEELRGSLHFIEDEEGTIFAEYFGVAQRVAPDEKTVRFLKISIRNNSEWSG